MNPVIMTVLTLLLLLPAAAAGESLAERLVGAARERTTQRVVYDGAYRTIGYPMGDVPDEVGVCTDLVIRAYRAVAIDLQVLVHEDMAAHFSDYPPFWNLSAPDPNIDHRRVPNLQRFLARAGAELPVSVQPADYLAGDLVTWMLPGNLPHIGIVSNKRVEGTRRPRVIHNIGAGPVEDDILFRYPITGHYRYPPPTAPASPAVPATDAAASRAR